MWQKISSDGKNFIDRLFSFDAVLKITAFAVAAGATLRNLFCLDLSNDTWEYHLPFAARLWGIVPKQMFELPDFHERCYNGFPLLLELLQGSVWSLFHNVHAVGLVNIVLIAGFIIFLRFYLSIPYCIAIISLFAVPMFQIHSTSWYIDLPANLFASVFVLMSFLLFTRPGFLNKKNIALMLAAATCATNTKFQTVPVVGLFLIASSARIIYLKTKTAPTNRAKWKIGGFVAVILLVLMPVIFFTEAKNVLLYHHPFYPMNTKDPEILMNIQVNIPPDLRNAPMPVKWFHSVFETRTKPGHWTLGADGGGPGSYDFRVGGYFGAYVVFQLLVFAWICFKKRRRETAVAFGFMATLTALTAFLPQANELRYYQYWIICLISFNAFFIYRLSAAGELKPAFQKSYAATCWAVLVFVLIATRGEFIKPEYRSFKDIMRNFQSKSWLRQFIQPGDNVCFYRHNWNSFFLASKFNPPKQYSIKAAFSPDECKGKDLIYGAISINGQTRKALARKMDRDRDRYQVILQPTRA